MRLHSQGQSLYTPDGQHQSLLAMEGICLCGNVGRCFRLDSNNQKNKTTHNHQIKIPSGMPKGTISCAGKLGVAFRLIYS